MAAALSSMLFYPELLPPKTTALRPVSASDAGEVAGERRFETRSETPSFLGGAAAFLAQLLAQDEPVEEQPDPFGDASRAYERFREERDTSLFVDARDPIDVKV